MEGKSYLDAVSSWWVNLFGHSNDRINKAIREQIEKLEHVIFANFPINRPLSWRRKSAASTPDGLNKVFLPITGHLPWKPP